MNQWDGCLKKQRSIQLFLLLLSSNMRYLEPISIGAVAALLDGVEDELLRLLDAVGTTQNLDGLVAGLVARDGDLASRGLADAVDLAAALADDIAVRLRVGQDQVACVAVLGGLLDRRQERCFCLGYVLGRAAQNPWDVSVYGRVCGVDHSP